MILVPSAANTSSKARVNLASRSRMRNRGAMAPSGRSINSSRARWTTQGPFGWRVTPTKRTCRVPSSITNSTYSVVSRTVSTVKKSVAMTPEACARRNAHQVTEGRRGAGPSPLPSSTVRMVVADTDILSFFSSPWMLRSPHRRFSPASRKEFEFGRDPSSMGSKSSSGLGLFPEGEPRRRIAERVPTRQNSTSSPATATMSGVSAEEIDAYLEGLEELKRATLAKLRDTIVAIVPDAEQCISYGMPAFKVGGKTIAGFAAFKNHLSYLPHSGSVIPKLVKETEGYTSTSGSLHFAIDKPLPKTLVKKLLAVRMDEAFDKR